MSARSVPGLRRWVLAAATLALVLGVREVRRASRERARAEALAAVAVEREAARTAALQAVAAERDAARQAALDAVAAERDAARAAARAEANAPVSPWWYMAGGGVLAALLGWGLTLRRRRARALSLRAEAPALGAPAAWEEAWPRAESRAAAPRGEDAR
jgi:hypothetical protein